MKIIVGLGNPGKKYKNNRHNVGFMLLDDYAEKHSQNWSKEIKFDCELSKGEEFILVKPQTSMNKSGVCTSKILNYYKIDPKDMIVVHDDVDLPFNKVRVRMGAGAAGHKGVESIFAHLGSKEMWRIRYGVGRHHNMAIDTEEWVLMDFTREELDVLKSVSLGDLLKEIGQ